MNEEEKRKSYKYIKIISVRGRVCLFVCLLVCDGVRVRVYLHFYITLLLLRLTSIGVLYIFARTENASSFAFCM